MPLRNRLPHHDTLGGFEFARTDRFEDGYHLAVEGRRMGAMCMLGHAVEITLKSAYYRWEGELAPNDPLRRERLNTTAAFGRDDLGIAVDHESFHSPLFWAFMIVERRRVDGSPLDDALAAGLIVRAQRVWSNWKVSMRYHRDLATADELFALFDEAEWINTHYDDLWS